MANSHTPATTDTISRPIGRTVPSSWRAPSRAAAAPPATNAPAVQTIPSTTEVHSSDAHGVTPCTAASVNIHSGSESASTRSPTLKTGPCPASRLWTIRKLMKASSSTHR